MVRTVAVVGLGIGCLIVAGGLAWAYLSSRQFQTELDLAKQQMDAGRYATAQQRLVALAKRWPGAGEVEFSLGVCEQALGRFDAAVAAWARVPRRSPFAQEAALWRAQVEMDRGRFAAAEDIATEALRGPGPLTTALRQFLIQLFWHQGRLDDARALIKTNWEAYSQKDGPESPSAIALLRRHLSWSMETYPIAYIREILERAGQDAPDDDRVWLARANLAIRSGAYDEATRLLNACLERRPQDPVVWRSVLELALASDQVELARRALRHLPADLDRSEILVPRLRAWFAARHGDAAAEQRAWEEWLTRDPGETAALERLAELAVASGALDRAAEFRRRKAALDEALHRYRALIDGDLEANAATMARLADTLGRQFEARAFRALDQKRREPDNAALAHLEPAEDAVRPPSPSSPPSLASLVLDASRSAREAPQPRPSEEAGVGATITFLDNAKAAGLEFIYHNGSSPLRQLPETSGGGVALLDYDGDGWLDVYVVQGGPFPPEPNRPHDGDRLFRNKGDGTFEDVTEAAGIAAFARGYGHGVTVADYDNDGWPDLFITRWRSYALYRNKGDGTFEDVTEAVGLGGDRDWPTSAAFADFDGDGDLDLYVCHYVVWDIDHPQTCRLPEIPDGFGYCNPLLFEAEPDRLYRNEGGRFVEVTQEAGITATDGRGLGVVAADLDDDGLIDLYVANDLTANFLYRNLGGMRFEEVGHEAGVASNAEGGYQAGMGIACGDLDGDGRPELAVTNFYGEATTLYRNLGGGVFADGTGSAGLRVVTRYRLGFGIDFLDANNDGALDLFQANGHVNDLRPLYPYAMPAQLLLGDGTGRLVDVSHRAGAPFQVPRVGRGLAVGDLDNDGRVDALLLAQNQPLAYFHNQTPGGHFVTLRLEGTASHRDAVGVRVTLSAGGRRQVAQRVGGGSYQSAGDPRLHFGLGDSERIDWLEVRWPSGLVERFENLDADTGYHLVEGDPTIRSLAGWSRDPSPSDRHARLDHPTPLK